MSVNIFELFTPAKTNRHSPKSPKALPGQNILAVLSHNRIDISEPNSETHVIRLPEEISPKICAFFLERGTGNAHMLLKLLTPN